jgi:hypothetical protein
MSWVADASAALTFVWVGLIAGISFLEAPLKFRAPGVTIPLGLGIGRLVFRALNRVELVLAVLITAGAVVGASDRLWPLVLAIAALVVLLVQLIFVRPALNRRSDAVLAGGAHETRSRTHLWYVGLEVVKLGVLIALGVVLLG